jgi:hypothetical protein
MALPFILGAAGGLAGFLGGRSREAEARRIEKMNREMSATDTLFSPRVATQAYQQAVPDAGPGALGGAFSGALSGFNQAQAMGSSKGLDNIYGDLLKKNKGANLSAYSSGQLQSAGIGLPGTGVA